MKIIFGLGNPGKKYCKNYHNLGYMAVDLLAEKLGVTLKKKRNNGLYGEANINGEKVMLVKPLTYMNGSGDCVLPFLSYYKCDLKDIMVIYDDIDIKKGMIRFRISGSAGTHNGMRSVVDLIGERFRRIRIGSKPEGGDVPLIDYVLSDIPDADMEVIRPAVVRAACCAFDFLSGKKDEELSAEYNHGESSCQPEKMQNGA